MYYFNKTVWALPNCQDWYSYPCKSKVNNNNNNNIQLLLVDPKACQRVMEKDKNYDFVLGNWKKYFCSLPPPSHTYTLSLPKKELGFQVLVSFLIKNNFLKEYRYFSLKCEETQEQDCRDFLGNQVQLHDIKSNHFRLYISKLRKLHFKTS